LRDIAPRGQAEPDGCLKLQLVLNLHFGR